jgi:hypothetical protein
MKTNETNIKTFSLFPTLIAMLNLIPAGSVTAQTFTKLYSFTAGSTNASGIQCPKLVLGRKYCYSLTHVTRFDAPVQ